VNLTVNVKLSKDRLPSHLPALSFEASKDGNSACFVPDADARTIPRRRQ
jgi:hypothetical protein